MNTDTFECASSENMLQIGMQHTSVTTVIHCELKQELDFPK